ncbi:hypothetical protein ACFX15_006596 [Malus domestica]
MELSIANHEKKKSIIDFKKDKVFSPNVDKTGKKPPKEAFIVNTTPIKTSSAPIKTLSAPIKTSFAPIKISSKTKAKEIKRDMDTMLDDLLKKKVIELPECKRPEEMNCVNDLRYCKYHRIVSHPVGKCFILK